MIAIILSGSDETYRKAREQGFIETTVYVKHVYPKDADGKRQIESQLMRELRPYQVLVSEYWGACVD